VQVPHMTGLALLVAGVGVLDHKPCCTASRRLPTRRRTWSPVGDVSRCLWTCRKVHSHAWLSGAGPRLGCWPCDPRHAAGKSRKTHSCSCSKRCCLGPLSDCCRTAVAGQGAFCLPCLLDAPGQCCRNMPPMLHDMTRYGADCGCHATWWSYPGAGCTCNTGCSILKGTD
jgi:hypothetical protein